MPAENEKIFVRRTKRGYLATYNGVKGKANTMFKAIERAQKNYLYAQEKNNDMLDSIEYGLLSCFERKTDYDTARSVD
jgi:hypothetical protein